MRRRALFILIIIMVSQMFVGTAFAGVKLYASSISGLSYKYDPDNNSITLKWKTGLTSRGDLGINTDVITISRGANSLNQSSIATINVNNVHKVKEIPQEGYTGSLEFTYTDTNVSLDKNFVYKVSCGSVGMKWQEITIAVNDLVTDEEETEGGAEDDPKKKYEDSADWPERLGSSILLAIPNYIVKILGLHDPLELIYQVDLDQEGSNFTTPEIASADESSVYLRTFTQGEFEALSNYYDRVNDYVPIYLVAIVVILGVVLLLASVSPNSRLSARDYIIGILIGVLILKFGIYLIAIVFDINYALVKAFQGTVSNELSSSFLDTLINPEANSLGSAIITFLAVFSIGLINWQYILRKIMLALLIGLIPIVAIIAIAPSKRNAIEFWLKEFLANVFMQASHAAALSLIILFIQGDTSIWISLVAIMSLPTISGIVRRVIGAESLGTSAASGIGTALGLGSLLAVGKMLKPDQKGATGIGGGTEALGGPQSSGMPAPRSLGGIMGGAAKTGFRAAAGVTAGVAGGIITGAATGNPGFGLATGAALGTAASGGIVNTADSIVGNLKKSPSERLDSQGIADPGQLDDPGQAYDYGKNLFGGGVIGSAAGMGMAAGKKIQAVTGQADPAMAQQVRNTVGQNAVNLASAQQSLSDHKPVYDGAKARATYAKNMYSPESAHMKGLKTQAAGLEGKTYDAESNYALALDNWQNNYEHQIGTPASMTPSAMSAMQGVQQAQEEAHAARAELGAVHEQISYGESEYKNATANLQAVEAEHAQKQITVSELQQSVSKAGIRKEFENLRSQGLETRGDINSTWR